jgi:putative redox protein
MGALYWLQADTTDRDTTRKARKDVDMATKDMTVQAVCETGMRFDVETGSGHHLLLDATAENGGQNTGPRPMEMLLVALATCAGMDILSILRKKRQIVTRYEVDVYGKRTEEYPRAFTDITVEHILTGAHIQPEAVQRAIELTEEKYCGATAMLGKSAKITHAFRIR